MAQSDGLHHAVTVYGADWCGDTTRTRQYLNDLDIEYNYYNIDKDEAMKRTATALSGGTKIPVVDFGSGTVLVEPSNGDVEKALYETGRMAQQ